MKFNWLLFKSGYIERMTSLSNLPVSDVIIITLYMLIEPDCMLLQLPYPWYTTEIISRTIVIILSTEVFFRAIIFNISFHNSSWSYCNTTFKANFQDCMYICKIPIIHTWIEASIVYILWYKSIDNPLIPTSPPTCDTS